MQPCKLHIIFFVYYSLANILDFLVGVVVNLYDYHLQGSGSSPLPGELRTPVTLALGQPSRIGIKLGTPNCCWRGGVWVRVCDGTERCDVVHAECV